MSWRDATDLMLESGEGDLREGEGTGKWEWIPAGPKVPLEAGSQNRAFSGFLSVPFLAKPVRIAPGLPQLFENLSRLWEQAYFTKSQC